MSPLLSFDSWEKSHYSTKRRRLCLFFQYFNHSNVPFVFCRHSPGTRQWGKCGERGVSASPGFGAQCLITQRQAQQPLTQNRWRSGRCKQKMPGRQTICKHTQGRFDKNGPYPDLLGNDRLATQPLRAESLSPGKVPLRRSGITFTDSSTFTEDSLDICPLGSHNVSFKSAATCSIYVMGYGFFHIYLEWSQMNRGGAADTHIQPRFRKFFLLTYKTHSENQTGNA